jgi:hypothetical protein
MYIKEETNTAVHWDVSALALDTLNYEDGEFCHVQYR